MLFRHAAVGQAAVIGSAHPGGTGAMAITTHCAIHDMRLQQRRCQRLGDMVVAWVTPKAGASVGRSELEAREAGSISANLGKAHPQHVERTELPGALRRCGYAGVAAP